MEETKTQSTPSATSRFKEMLSGNNKKRLTVIVSIMMLAIAIPATIFLSQQEQDIRQRADELSCSVDNVDVILVIDSSNSMQGAKLNEAKAAASAFVNLVMPAGNTENRVGIAHFDNNGGLRRGLTTDKGAILSTINGLSVPGNGKGGTCLECAIDKRGDGDVLSAFADSSKPRNKRHVIILTDGNINRWMQPDGDIEGSTKPADENKARTQALNAVNTVRSQRGAVFSAVQYGSGANAGWLSTQIVQAPGVYQAEKDGENLNKMYTDLANKLMGGTVIAYVFDDKNRNATKDTGEGPLANVDVALRMIDNSKPPRTDKTNAEGAVRFTNVCAQPQELVVL